MKTNTVPSLACKGNGMTLGLTDGTNNFGLWSYNDVFPSDVRTGLYGTNVGSSTSSGTIKQQKSIGITTDQSKSGIITDTGSMSSITSKAIIKY